MKTVEDFGIAESRLLASALYVFEVEGFVVLSPDERAILSKLLRGYVVGPDAQKVLDKVHGQ